MADDFAAALAKGEFGTAINEHYTADVILKSLCPEQPPIVGRDAYLKLIERSVKGGFRDYASKPNEAHLISDDRAWTSGTYSFTINGKDGKPVQVQSNWIDMLRREGNQWKVSFQAFARTHCQ
jgi:ketosteroid isomerase-like protein